MDAIFVQVVAPNREGRDLRGVRFRTGDVALLPAKHYDPDQYRLVEGPKLTKTPAGVTVRRAKGEKPLAVIQECELTRLTPKNAAARISVATRQEIEEWMKVEKRPGLLTLMRVRGELTGGNHKETLTLE